MSVSHVDQVGASSCRSLFPHFSQPDLFPRTSFAWTAGSVRSIDMVQYLLLLLAVMFVPLFCVAAAAGNTSAAFGAPYAMLDFLVAPFSFKHYRRHFKYAEDRYYERLNRGAVARIENSIMVMPIEHSISASPAPSRAAGKFWIADY